MAKMRVYELAKELNMTHAALLKKLKELKIEVKSHMSSLNDNNIAAVKTSLFGPDKKNKDVKVRSDVIRRRRSSSKDSSPEKTEEESVLPMDKPDKPDKSDESIPTKEKEAPEPPSDVVSDEQDKEQSRDKKKKKKAAVKKTQPAKIIKPVSPVEEETQKESDRTAKAEIKPDDELSQDQTIQDQTIKESDKKLSPEPKADTQPELGEAEKTSEKEDHTDAENLELSAEAGNDTESSKGEKTVPSKESDSSSKSQPSDSQEDKPKRTRAKKKKKKKKTTPAKIVKIADPDILENLKKPAVSDDTQDKAEKKSTHSAKEDSKPKAAKDKGKAKLTTKKVEIDSPKPAKGKKDKYKAKDEAGDTQSRRKSKKRHRKKSVIEGDALYSGGRSRKKHGKREATAPKNKFKKTQITVPKAIKRRVKIDEAIELAELAKRMGIKANEMIAKLMTLGVMATVNQTIDFETAVLVASEFDFEIEKASFEEDVLLHIEEDESEEQLLERAPVVTIMGHVDHGKTSLLDVIRKSKIASGETGGITQHIGAYNVQTSKGGRITFLDTPGHAAFTAMRSRGAQVTDIVILVVAADDGVMPQTVEAINHSKAAGVPVVVAINKMDKPGADPTRIMRELSEHDLLAEDWGGNVIFVQVSAKAGTGIEDLLEMVLLQSEVLELKANPDKKAFGYVIESRLDIGRGAVATVLVMQGTLRDGDSIVCGLHSGRIRAMIDDAGNRTNEAGPSTPVEIVGLTGIPNAGDEFIAVASDKDAKQIANHRMQKQRAKELAKKSRANLEKMFEKLGGPEVKELRLIVKADVQGSIEALNDSLKDLAKKEVDIKIIHSATGTINESDIPLAAVSDAIIVGFNVRPTPQIRALAKEENVDMRFYDIIYDVINDIQSALDGLMPSTFHEKIIGRANVRDTFIVPNMGTIAGCYITEGKVIRGKKVRLLREGIIKCDTALSSLRRFKDDVKEVEQNFECGIGLEKYNDIKLGDVIECYEVEEKKYKAE